MWRKNVFGIHFTEFGADLTTVLPVLFKYCCKYCYSVSRKLWAVMKGEGFALSNRIQSTIPLEMPVPSQGHYGFHSFPVVDWFFLFIYVWVLTFPLLDCSEFCNFFITLISITYNFVLSGFYTFCIQLCYISYVRKSPSKCFLFTIIQI